MSNSEALAHDIRRTVIDCSRRADVGHIGSALSIADLLAALFGTVLGPPRPDDPDRDRFVLSKGHAALALYAALASTGVLTAQDLLRFCVDGSALAAHPEHTLRGIDFSTGSLGHGLSIAAGAALAARLKQSQRRAFALLSDAECNEGSVWEAAMFAAHHRLDNLIAIIDVNGQQALGPTREVLDIEPLGQRWSVFGWDVREVDGHDTDAIVAEIVRFGETPGSPHVLIARTVFGKGVSYMEGQLAWHYSPMSEEQHGQALAELARADARATVP
jgi:transketolase